MSNNGILDEIILFNIVRSHTYVSLSCRLGSLWTLIFMVINDTLQPKGRFVFRYLRRDSHKGCDDSITRDDWERRDNVPVPLIGIKSLFLLFLVLQIFRKFIGVDFSFGYQKER